MTTLKRNMMLLALCLVSLAAVAQSVPSWLETTHDFGKFRDSLKSVSTTMRVVNRGDSALVITRVQSNCGCTVAEYTPPSH